jgi:hypothetical protein
VAGKRDPSGEFDAFVKGQQPAEPDDGPVNWEQERTEWLRHLNELYEKIESFLAKYIESGEIKRDYREIPLNEENIGSYTAREMILRIGRQEVTLTPIGTLLIGVKGRVDVVGPAGQGRFVLVDSAAVRPQVKVTVSIGGKANASRQEAPPKAKWAWKIATSPPIIQYIELTPESLFQTLMEVANG